MLVEQVGQLGERRREQRRAAGRVAGELGQRLLDTGEQLGEFDVVVRERSEVDRAVHRRHDDRPQHVVLAFVVAVDLVQEVPA